MQKMMEGRWYGTCGCSGRGGLAGQVAVLYPRADFISFFVYFQLWWAVAARAWG